jgi:hypothetical protein
MSKFEIRMKVELVGIEVKRRECRNPNQLRWGRGRCAQAGEAELREEGLPKLELGNERVKANDVGLRDASGYN